MVKRFNLGAFIAIQNMQRMARDSRKRRMEEEERQRKEWAGRHINKNPFNEDEVDEEDKDNE